MRMWVTTKSIVKEIKKNQEELMVKIEDITLAQNETQFGIQNQISELKERIGSIEALISEFKTEQEVKFSKLLLAISEIGDFLKSMCDNLVVSYESNTKKIEETINQVSNEKSKETLDSLNSSVKKIINIIESASAQREEKMMADVSQILDSEKDIVSKVSELSIQSGALEQIIHVAADEIEQRIQEQRNDLLEEVHRINGAIAEASFASEKRNEAFTENATSMNIAMQEIVRNLLSLDEGNRLIIAKFLLKDMEG